jgi:hypothetical protein
MAEERFKDGTVSGAGEYVNSECNGPWVFYFRDGQEKMRRSYDRGKLTGFCVWYRTGGGSDYSILTTNYWGGLRGFWVSTP